MAKISIKRSYEVFNAIIGLWLIINPYNLKKLSRSNFHMLNEFFYQHAIIGLPNHDKAALYAQNDTDVDFGKNQGVYFYEFYDSIFEFVDNFTKSKLITEYVRFIKRLTF